MSNSLKNDLLLRALAGKKVHRPPIWLLRQAGRYQQEYRKLRVIEPDFTKFYKNPELTTKAALIPITNYNLDAAILFSDILTVPEAMGLDLNFVENTGPVFSSPIQENKEIQNIDIAKTKDKLEFISRTTANLKQALASEIPLIGFCGSPWTIATYMLEGKSSKTFSRAKSFAYRNSVECHNLLEKITKVSNYYLDLQIAAGANAIMVFDTWGGLLPHEDYKNFSLKYMRDITQHINNKYKNNIPVIIYTKGGSNWLNDIGKIGCKGVAIDWSITIDNARKLLPENICIQGNLDPSVLYASEEVIKERALEILRQNNNNVNFIFNLGHGIPKDIDPRKIKFLADLILDFQYKTNGINI